MTDPTRRFFERLQARGHEPLLAKVTGTVRFDLLDAGARDSWLVTINGGNVSVAHDSGDAECIIEADKALFDQLTCGQANAMTAVLRNTLRCHGDVELLFAIQRLFPGPARTKVVTTGQRAEP